MNPVSHAEKGEGRFLGGMLWGRVLEKEKSSKEIIRGEGSTFRNAGDFSREGDEPGPPAEKALNIGQRSGGPKTSSGGRLSAGWDAGSKKKKNEGGKAIIEER